MKAHETRRDLAVVDHNADLCRCRVCRHLSIRQCTSHLTAPSPQQQIRTKFLLCPCSLALSNFRFASGIIRRDHPALAPRLRIATPATQILAAPPPDPCFSAPAPVPNRMPMAGQMSRQRPPFRSRGRRSAREPVRPSSSPDDSPLPTLKSLQRESAFLETRRLPQPR
jgi:hypothetical protein